MSKPEYASNVPLDVPAPYHLRERQGLYIQRIDVQDRLRGAAQEPETVSEPIRAPRIRSSTSPTASEKETNMNHALSFASRILPLRSLSAFAGSAICRRISPSRRWIGAFALGTIVLSAGCLPPPDPIASASPQGDALLTLPVQQTGSELVALSTTTIEELDGAAGTVTQNPVRLAPGIHNLTVVNRRCAVPLLVLTCHMTEEVRQARISFRSYPGAKYRLDADNFTIIDTRTGEIVSQPRS